MDSKKYRVIQTVASGGTAVLFKAVQTSLDRVVAVKRLHQHLTDDENFTNRFILEAKAAASLDHENIVHVIDFGREGDCYQMVMEFVDGESLSDILDRWRPIKYDLALALVAQICLGLEHAHAKGIVHRDIKPGNVMLTPTGRAKITDFGLAKLTQANTSHTAANSILGTPLYMSPEQAFGESVDQRSDLFSLGTMLFEMVTGKQPFASDNYMGVIQNIINKDIPGVQKINGEIPDDVAEIVDKSLAKNREHRFQSAREFREAVESLMGLERLSEATSKLKVLLERPTTTTVLPNSGHVKKRKRKSSAGGAVALGVFLAVAAASLAVILNPSLLDYVRAPFEAGEPTPARTQHSTLGDAEGFDLDATDLIGEADVGSDSNVASGDEGSTGDTPLRMTGDLSKAFTASDSPENTDAEANSPDRAVQEPPRTPARMGYLKIDARPSAEVYVDGIYKGDTPPAISMKLTAGDHKLECRHPRYEDYREVLRIVNGELSRRVITLKALKGSLSLSTQEGAEIYIDGKLVGVTPIGRPIELDSGQHMVTLKKTGYHTWNSEVTVEPRKALPLRITLSPRY